MKPVPKESSLPHFLLPRTIFNSFIINCQPWWWWWCWWLIMLMITMMIMFLNVLLCSITSIHLSLLQPSSLSLYSFDATYQFSTVFHHRKVRNQCPKAYPYPLKAVTWSLMYDLELPWFCYGYGRCEIMSQMFWSWSSGSEAYFDIERGKW